ncbi:hypothetical protein HYR99_06680 [Candidatus Poribacteria bacterium]|nr:hypothetical protein [Candidatus Poribacteria bacterium]
MELNYEGITGEIRTDAYHGTDLASAVSILQSGFIPQLGIAGVGAYFDLGNDASSQRRALEKGEGELSKAVIIQAEVHLSKVIEVNFRHNPAIAAKFISFQSALKKKLSDVLPLNFNEQKELFIQERYPDVNAVSYFNIAEQILTVSVRDPKRIKVLSAVTLTGRRLR